MLCLERHYPSRCSQNVAIFAQVWASQVWAPPALLCSRFCSLACLHRHDVGEPDRLHLTAWRPRKRKEEQAYKDCGCLAADKMIHAQETKADERRKTRTS
mmetsp:Transcript_13740/g.39231  ORF Transcript_13740/g.39231 Transcript_13740/m.39231 type:complete len:100 (+) Transcript_13740:1375-1674(+)